MVWMLVTTNKRSYAIHAYAYADSKNVAWERGEKVISIEPITGSCYK